MALGIPAAGLRGADERETGSGGHGRRISLRWFADCRPSEFANTTPFGRSYMDFGAGAAGLVGDTYSTSAGTTSRHSDKNGGQPFAHDIYRGPADHGSRRGDDRWSSRRRPMASRDFLQPILQTCELRRRRPGACSWPLERTVEYSSSSPV